MKNVLLAKKGHIFNKLHLFLQSLRINSLFILSIQLINNRSMLLTNLNLDILFFNGFFSCFSRKKQPYSLLQSYFQELLFFHWARKFFRKSFLRLWKFPRESEKSLFPQMKRISKVDGQVFQITFFSFFHSKFQLSKMLTSYSSLTHSLYINIKKIILAICCFVHTKNRGEVVGEKCTG